jgi:cephalosporin hydroxylase
MKKKRAVLGLLLIVLVLILFHNRRYFWNSPGVNKWPKEEIVKKFTQVYYASRVHDRTTWLGVSALQNPCDMWSMQEIISEIKPDFIIETGTYKGGGALYFATILQNVNGAGKVITVDINPQVEAASKFKVFQERVEVIQGSSVSTQVTDQIARRVADSKVIVTLDSNHHKDHVLKELEIYSKFVSLGSYLIVQDTAHHGHPLQTDYGEGPMEALSSFLKTNQNFVVDSSREKFLLTFFPQGYLKRIK